MLPSRHGPPLLPATQLWEKVLAAGGSLTLTGLLSLVLGALLLFLVELGRLEFLPLGTVDTG